MFTLTIVLFDKFQHFVVSFSKRGLGSAHSWFGFAYPDNAALQHAIRYPKRHFSLGHP